MVSSLSVRRGRWGRRSSLLLLPLLGGSLLLLLALLDAPPAGRAQEQQRDLPSLRRLGPDSARAEPETLPASAEPLFALLPLQEEELLAIGFPRRPRSGGDDGYGLRRVPDGRRQRERPLLSTGAPLRRKLPDYRHPLCLQHKYRINLPLASVIICFHDEAWSTLLRTVHSVLDTAPKRLLKEIILVDDLSQQGRLKSALSEYISKLEGVKLMRSNKRLGAIKGRMLGAARATGDVLVFLDSHCECHRGWLEPLLDRIASDRNRIVSPVQDVIDWKTFQYHRSADLRRGAFDWKLDFHWSPLPEREEKVRQTPISPIRSPVVPGGAVAVDRHYFQNIGSYDSGMSMMGTGNLELSIRVWLCGGSVEILPCSRVGHVYHSHKPFSLSDREAMVKNKIRLAETWMDSFKDVFYKHNMEAFLISRAKKADYSERLQLQKRLSCKGFHWYMSVFPEHNTSEDRPEFSGKARHHSVLYNVGLGDCADYRFKWNVSGHPVEFSSCSSSGNQKQHLLWTLKNSMKTT
ncbi:polypeptide N-acetylgalactosaminyltransferase 15 isoform X3 [Rhinatrema bivittatum]|uniref:polypeptide N-acetylgalactosaminyltransferase 15 isoform X3 n=1 Tax=Rhinatrema bivittatum TaxID=194408 RepID=UPI00112D8046|nr:polypeptide N-acetylgalactosaminyltransferase 15 isoform X3 [Rhinatrema bivittatum]